MILIALLYRTKRDGITIITITASSLDSCQLNTKLRLTSAVEQANFHVFWLRRVEKVVAIDLSPGMIEVAKQRSRQLSNIDFQVADVLQWELPDENFDVIVSIATLHHLPTESLLPNLKAGLKPGGRLVILDLLEHENLRDRLSDFIAVPLNWCFQVFKNRHLQQSSEAAAAMREHVRTDKYLTLSQAQRIYTSLLRRAKVRKHLFWRYSVVWEKSAAA